MKDHRNAGAILSGVGVVLVASRLTGIAQGQQIAIGLFFILIGAGIYFVTGRSE